MDDNNFNNNKKVDDGEKSVDPDDAPSVSLPSSEQGDDHDRPRGVPTRKVVVANVQHSEHQASDDDNDDGGVDKDNASENRDKDNDASENQGDDDPDMDEDEQQHAGDENGDNDDGDEDPDKDDDDDSDSSSSSDDDSNKKQAAHQQGLSDYELMRLERIRRNREYLLKLGLEDMAATKPKKRRSRSNPPASSLTEPVKRSSRARKHVNYAEPPVSVASLLRSSNHEKQQQSEKMASADGDAASTATSQKETTAGGAPAAAATEAQLPAPPAQQQRKRAANGQGKHNPNNRRERFIYDEFKTITAHKKRILREAEKTVRAAEKEVSYWNKRTVVWNRHEERKRHAEDIRRMYQEVRDALGGGTVRQLLHEVDRRTPELLQAVARYDAVYEDAVRVQEREAKRLESEYRMKLLDALDRFPKAVKTATSLLNAVLLERAPKDPPPPRRSSRAAADAPSESTPKKQQGCEKKVTSNTPDEKAHDGDRSWSPTLAVPVDADRMESLSNTKNKEDQQGATKRKKMSRNVGGWISPNFAHAINRSWLEKDVSMDKFDLMAYVPQVGDTVLYYPSGHKEYLEKFPDVLGKKLRSTSRIPLWERAATEKEGQSGKDDTESSKNPPADSWWNEEWLAGFEANFANYPIVCRVERTHAEFPPDPFTKSVKKDGSGNVVNVSWKAPKDPGIVKRISGTPLRLAIGLRPLTPLLPPTWSSDVGPRDEKQLPLPPSFTAVSFPCSDMTPFVVPFAWGYAASHSFAIDDVVVSITKSNFGKIRVREVAALGDSWGSMRLDDKLHFAKSLVERGSLAASTDGSLSTDLSTYAQTFPAQAAQSVLSVLERALQDRENVDGEERQLNCNVVHFIRSTLPLWGSVSAMSSIYDRKKLHFSPWELKPLRQGRSGPTLPQQCVLDDGLRDKIDFVIDNLVSDEETAESASLFHSPVTDEIAPSYSCAVPLGMCLSKILHRLRPKGSRRCYYRGIDSLLADVAAILDNCLLYNSPDSLVVNAAVEIVSKLKESISKIAQTHYRELTDARKMDEERRQQVLRQLAPSSRGAITEDRDASRRPVISTLQTPFVDPVDREWLLQLKENSAGAHNVEWVPQAGDKIAYSRRCHELFVKGHFPSLGKEQCELLNDTVGLDQNESLSDQVLGTIQWVRPAFPKALSSKSSVDANTFKTSAVVLAFGVKLTKSNTTGVVYWRPCILASDCTPGKKAPTCQCGLSIHESFLCPGDESPLPNDSSSDQFSGGDSSGLLSRSRQEDISLLFNLLKKRCLRQVCPSFVDPELTKVSVKHGYKPPSTKSGLRNVPKYDHLFLENAANPLSDCSSRVATRVAPRKSLVNDPSRDRLSDFGFLPSWSHGSHSDKEKELQQCESTMPLPQLSAELVQLRLKNGAYRHVAAIENDLIESFVTTVVLHIRASASRKKSPISMKRMTRAMISNKGHQGTPNDSSAETPALSRLSEEESKFVDHLRQIRDLYAVALVAASDTVHMTHLFGLSQPSETALQSLVLAMPEQDPARADARQKISYLLSAVGRDQSQYALSSSTVPSYRYRVPAARLKLTCGGQTFGYPKTVKRRSHTVAYWKRKEVKVKLVCGGKAFYVDRPFNPEDPVGRGDVVQVRQTAIEFKPSELESNAALARVFFGRPGRMDPCARCQAYKRSFYECRKRLAHSNLDYDWLAMFKGVGGVDGLISALHPDSMSSATADHDLNKPENEPSSSMSIQQTTRKESTRGDTEEQPGDAEDQPESSKGQNVATEEDEALDPREFQKKTMEALRLARRLHHKAVEYSEAPIRLGKDFISTNFPIDEDDGHFIYCVICGLSGDLLCCDGCSNVLHSMCIGLPEVPDGEWFCEECQLAGKGGEASAKDKKLPPKQAACGADQVEHLPFGRVEFNEEQAEELSLTIESLRDLRPERQKQKEEAANVETPQDEEPKSDEKSADQLDEESSVEDTTKPYRLRKRRRTSTGLSGDSSTQGSPPPAKKPRDRPRSKSAAPPDARDTPSSKRPRKNGEEESESPAAKKRRQTKPQRDETPVLKRPVGRPAGRSRKSGVQGTPKRDATSTGNSPKRRGRPKGKTSTTPQERTRGRAKTSGDVEEEDDDDDADSDDGSRNGDNGEMNGTRTRRGGRNRTASSDRCTKMQGEPNESGHKNDDKEVDEEEGNSKNDDGAENGDKGESNGTRTQRGGRKRTSSSDRRQKAESSDLRKGSRGKTKDASLDDEQPEDDDQNIDNDSAKNLAKPKGTRSDEENQDHQEQEDSGSDDDSNEEAEEADSERSDGKSTNMGRSGKAPSGMHGFKWRNGMQKYDADTPKRPVVGSFVEDLTLEEPSEYDSLTPPLRLSGRQSRPPDRFAYR